MTDGVTEVAAAKLGLKIDPSLPVIPKNYLDPGEPADQLSIKGDKEWDLTPGIARTNVPTHDRKVRFEDYPIEYAELIWAYSWLCMNFDHSCVATNLAAVPPARVRREAKRLLRY